MTYPRIVEGTRDDRRRRIRRRLRAGERRRRPCAPVAQVRRHHERGNRMMHPNPESTVNGMSLMDEARRALAREVQAALLAAPSPAWDYSSTAIDVADALIAAGYGDTRELEAALDKVRKIVECYPVSTVSFQVSNAIAGVR